MTRLQWMLEVEKLASAVANRRGLALVALDVLGDGRGTIVRVSVEGETGVSVEQCAEVAEELGRALDLHDPIPHGYTLEVASPGLDRPLRTGADFQRFAGRKIEVTMYEAVDGRRRWKGRLVGLEGDQVVLDMDAQSARLPLEGIARAHLVVEMDDLREDFTKGGRVGP